MNENINSELQHYGVLGMKWGVRKNPSKAYRKASVKADYLRKKTDKRQIKAIKKRAKADKIGARWAGIGLASGNDVRKTSKQAYRAERKLRKAAKKSDKWEAEMLKAFRDIKVSDIKPDDLERGRNYVDMLIREED